VLDQHWGLDCSGTVPAYFLPEGVRPSLVAGRAGLMALVSADDSPMAFRDESAADWLSENGL
jgi:hypothetical protein